MLQRGTDSQVIVKLQWSRFYLFSNPSKVNEYMHSMRSLIFTFVYIWALKSGMQFSTYLFYHSTTFVFFSLIPPLEWHLCLLKSHSIVTNHNQKRSSPKWTASVMNERLSVLPLTVHRANYLLSFCRSAFSFTWSGTYALCDWIFGWVIRTTA